MVKNEKKVYAYEVFGELSETFDTVDDMLKCLSDDDRDPSECVFYELTPGTYTPLQRRRRSASKESEMARMKYHGGTCCGIAHLYLEGRYDPEKILPPMKKFDWLNFKETADPIIGYPMNTGKSVPSGVGMGYPPKFSDNRPEESAKDRALALIEVAKGEGARHGIIEVVLAGNNQKKGWHDILVSWGFKECVTALNSNSMNNITVYLLGY